MSLDRDLPAMADSWRLDPSINSHTNHTHKLSASDPWISDAVPSHNNAGPSSAPVRIPTHYHSDPRKGKEKEKEKDREREMMELVKYDLPVWLSVMGDMMDTSKGRDKVLVSSRNERNGPQR